LDEKSFERSWKRGGFEGPDLQKKKKKNRSRGKKKRKEPRGAAYSSGLPGGAENFSHTKKKSRRTRTGRIEENRGPSNVRVAQPVKDFGTTENRRGNQGGWGEKKEEKPPRGKVRLTLARGTRRRMYWTDSSTLQRKRKVGETSPICTEPWRKQKHSTSSKTPTGGERKGRQTTTTRYWCRKAEDEFPSGLEKGGITPAESSRKKPYMAAHRANGLSGHKKGSDKQKPRYLRAESAPPESPPESLEHTE